MVQLHTHLIAGTLSLDLLKVLKSGMLSQDIGSYILKAIMAILLVHLHILLMGSTLSLDLLTKPSECGML